MTREQTIDEAVRRALAAMPEVAHNIYQDRRVPHPFINEIRAEFRRIMGDQQKWQKPVNYTGAWSAH